MRLKHHRQRIELRMRNEKLYLHKKEYERNMEQMNYLQRIINKYDSQSKNYDLILRQLKKKYYHYENCKIYLQNKMSNIQCHFL